MQDFIKLSSEIISMMPVYTFVATKEKLVGIQAPTGANTEDMPAAREILALFAQFQDILESYSELIGYDGERMKKIISAFVETDK